MTSSRLLCSALQATLDVPVGYGSSRQAGIFTAEGRDVGSLNARRKFRGAF